MLRRISIKNLRGIREGELIGITPLTILVGPNNAGKSTVLDAMFVGTNGPREGSLAFLTNRRKKFDQNHEWLLFRQGGDIADCAEIQVKTDSPQMRTALLGYIAEPPRGSLFFVTFSSDKNADPQPVDLNQRLRSNSQSPALGDVPATMLVDPDSVRLPLHEVYTDVAKRGLTRQAIEIVTALVPTVQDVQILVDKKRDPNVFVFYKSGALPLAASGDGMRLLIEMSFQLAAPIGGLVLLEEPEIHMHPGAIRQVARCILAAVARHIQIVLTTHSLELIDSLLDEADADRLDDISLFRLRLEDGQLNSYRLSGKEAERARLEIRDDLR